MQLAQVYANKGAPTFLAFERVFIPINVDQRHWIFVCVMPSEFMVYCYDSSRRST